MSAKPTIAEAWVGLLPSMDGFSKELNAGLTGLNTSAAGTAAGTAFGGAFTKSAAKLFLPLLGVLGVGAIFQGVGDSLSEAVWKASDLNESLNAIHVQFGDVAGDINALGTSAADSLGLSNTEFNSLAGQFAGFVKTISGPGGDVAATLDDLTTRAADFASVVNLDVAEAATLFQSGLAGETEPLRRYSIDLSAAAVEAFALSEGIWDGTGAMTEAQKVQARYASLMAQTTAMQGDFANTSDGLANAQRRLSAQWQNVQAKLGTILLPIVAKFTDLLADSMPVVSMLADFVVQLFQAFDLGEDSTAAFSTFLESIKPSLETLGVVIAEQVAPHLGELAAVFVDEILPALVEIAPPLAELVALFVQFATPSTVAAILLFLKSWGFLAQIAGAQMRFFADVLRGAADFIVWWKDRTIQSIQNVIGWFKGLPGTISAAWSGLVGIITGPFKTAFNKIADLWNGSVGKLAFSLPGVGKVTMPKIPKLAEGGVVTRPTLAMIGEGRYAEAVLPLPELDARLNAAAGSGSADTVTYLRRILTQLERGHILEADGVALARTASHGRQLLAAGGGV